MCTPPRRGDSRGRDRRLTATLATADDEAIPALVEERRAMREELGELRGARACDEGVVSLEDERARRGREPLVQRATLSGATVSLALLNDLPAHLRAGIGARPTPTARWLVIIDVPADQTLFFAISPRGAIS